jgi:hypothetical protein
VPATSTSTWRAGHVTDGRCSSDRAPSADRRSAARRRVGASGRSFDALFVVGSDDDRWEHASEAERASGAWSAPPAGAAVPWGLGAVGEQAILDAELGAGARRWSAVTARRGPEYASTRAPRRSPARRHGAGTRWRRRPPSGGRNTRRAGEVARPVRQPPAGRPRPSPCGPPSGRSRRQTHERRTKRRTRPLDPQPLRERRRQHNPGIRDAAIIGRAAVRRPVTFMVDDDDRPVGPP